MIHMFEEALLNVHELVAYRCPPDLAETLRLGNRTVHNFAGSLLGVRFGISGEIWPVLSVLPEEYKPEGMMLPADGEKGLPREMCCC